MESEDSMRETFSESINNKEDKFHENSDWIFN